MRRIALCAALSCTALLLFLPATSGARATCHGKRATKVGTNGNDVMRGGHGTQVFIGLGGNDRIMPGGGRDVVCGGSGNDKIYGGGGQDKLDAGSGRNFVNGGSQKDFIWGGSSPDTLLGGTGADKIFGGGGDDYLDGGSAKDTIDGNGGNDLLYGGDGGDRINGGPGLDRIFGGIHDDRLKGGPGDDEIRGGHGIDAISGDSGEDLIRGGVNRDRFQGGAGYDTLTFATATPILGHADIGVSVNGGRVKGDGATEKFSGFERILGSAFNDKFEHTGNMDIDGGGGDDSCCGDGHDPDRSVWVDDRSSVDVGIVIAGGEGSQSDNWVISRAGSGVVRIVSSTPLAADTDSRCHEVSESPTTIECNASPDFILAASRGGDDKIVLKKGFPATMTTDLDGGTGDDYVSGSTEDDVIIDAGGADRMLGGGGSDALVARVGGDYVNGGPGNDQLVTDDPCSRNIFIGGGGPYDVAGFAPSPYGIRGKIGGKVRSLRHRAGCPGTKVTTSSEVLEGTGAKDVLTGSPGVDYLVARGGNDRLFGLAGGDHLAGATGHDLCDGGSGADVFSACERRR